MYLDGSNSSIGNSESLMAVIDHLLSLDAMIMLDNLDVEGSYAPLVVELLPTLLRIDRLLRLQGLPADSVACTRLSLCVKLPAALIRDFSTPNAISTFVSWLPRILTSIQDERRAQPLRYTSASSTTPCSARKTTGSGRPRQNSCRPSCGLFSRSRLDTIDNVPDPTLETLFSGLLPKAQAALVLRRWL
ncbi:hypothetical protein CPB85DRAFT_164869 [Mucidula mucida]|nr:hypothetical protein CPB85DRAFT_164869 [Mucidula mucida]